MTSYRSFSLVTDRIARPGVADSSAAAATACTAGQFMRVPAGCSFLFVSADGRPALSTEAPGPPAAALLLEPVFAGAQPLLIVISPAGRPTRINGGPVPRFALLREQDQLQLDDALLLHLVLFTDPYVGVLPAELVGTACPICRQRLVAGSRVFICPHCGRPLHLEASEKPAAARLECALAASACPVCGSRIDMSPGYSSEPALYAGGSADANP